MLKAQGCWDEAWISYAATLPRAAASSRPELGVAGLPWPLSLQCAYAAALVSHRVHSSRVAHGLRSTQPNGYSHGCAEDPPPSRAGTNSHGRVDTDSRVRVHVHTYNYTHRSRIESKRNC